MADTADMPDTAAASRAARRIRAARPAPVRRSSAAVPVTAAVTSPTGVTSGASSSEVFGTITRTMTITRITRNIRPIPQPPAAASSRPKMVRSSFAFIARGATTTILGVTISAGIIAPIVEVRAVGEMSQAPARAPDFLHHETAGLRCSPESPLNPVLEFPGLDFPRRERLQPPLLPALRRPMAETRRLLGHRFLDRAGHDPAPPLLRRLADHIDEFSFVGHGVLPSRNFATCCPASLPGSA